ncbi:MAG TPA: sulfite exporter TauE/SafE family protein [Methylophilus sp.]
MSEIQLISIGLGLFIGMVLALTGAGGTLLSIPLLVFALHLNIQQAAPIALVSIFAASSLGALNGLSKGLVRYKAALVIAGFGIALAPLGVLLAHQLSHTVLSLMLVSVLLFVAMHMWRNTQAVEHTHLPPASCAINPATSTLFWTASCTKQLILTGSFSGFLSGLLGVGGGFVIVPSLHKVSNLSHATIVATSLAAVALVSATSVASYWQRADILWPIAIPFAVSCIAAMLVLGLLQDKIPRQYSQKGFALLCVIAALYMGAQAILTALSH